MPKSISLSKAKTGQSYQVCTNDCEKSTGQKLTLMGLGVGMIVELIALYKHGAVVQTPFGDIAIGSDLIQSISVSLT